MNGIENRKKAQKSKNWFFESIKIWPESPGEILP